MSGISPCLSVSRSCTPAINALTCEHMAESACSFGFKIPAVRTRVNSKPGTSHTLCTEGSINRDYRGTFVLVGAKTTKPNVCFFILNCCKVSTKWRTSGAPRGEPPEGDLVSSPRNGALPHLMLSCLFRSVTVRYVGRLSRLRTSSQKKSS